MTHPSIKAENAKNARKVIQMLRDGLQQYHGNNPRLLAAAQGLTRYEGNPCKVCGGTIKSVKSYACVACHNERNRKYQKKRAQTYQAGFVDGYCTALTTMEKLL